jgi:hypothetical protein
MLVRVSLSLGGWKSGWLDRNGCVGMSGVAYRWFVVGIGVN